MINITTFKNGDKILEPDTSNPVLFFTSEKELCYHAIKHIFVMRSTEKWENICFIDRNVFARLLKTNKIADFLSIADNFYVEDSLHPDIFSETCNKQRVERKKLGKNRKRDRGAVAKQQEDNDFFEKQEPFHQELKDFIHNSFDVYFRDCSDAMDIIKKYHKYVSKLFIEGCNGSVPHFHMLKIKNSNNQNKKRQVVKLYNPQQAIMVIASVNLNDENSVERFCISSSYRFLIHRSEGERIEKFNNLEKLIIDIEKRHDRKYNLKEWRFHNKIE